MRCTEFLRHALQLTGFGTVLILIASVCPHGSAFAQQRGKPEARTAFKSGGARSEIVLKEIAATLKQIDARLERLEKFAGRQQ